MKITPKDHLDKNYYDFLENDFRKIKRFSSLRKKLEEKRER